MELCTSQPSPVIKSPVRREATLLRPGGSSRWRNHQTLESPDKAPRSHGLRVRAVSFTGGDQRLITDGMAGTPEGR